MPNWEPPEVTKTETWEPPEVAKTSQAWEPSEITSQPTPGFAFFNSKGEPWTPEHGEDDKFEFPTQEHFFSKEYEKQKEENKPGIVKQVGEIGSTLGRGAVKAIQKSYGGLTKPLEGDFKGALSDLSRGAGSMAEAAAQGAEMGVDIGKTAAGLVGNQYAKGITELLGTRKNLDQVLQKEEYEKAKEHTIRQTRRWEKGQSILGDLVRDVDKDFAKFVDSNVDQEMALTLGLAGAVPIGGIKAIGNAYKLYKAGNLAKAAEEVASASKAFKESAKVAETAAADTAKVAEPLATNIAKAAEPVTEIPTAAENITTNLRSKEFPNLTQEEILNAPLAPPVITQGTKMQQTLTSWVDKGKELLAKPLSVAGGVLDQPLSTALQIGGAGLRKTGEFAGKGIEWAVQHPKTLAAAAGGVTLANEGDLKDALIAAGSTYVGGNWLAKAKAMQNLSSRMGTIGDLVSSVGKASKLGGGKAGLLGAARTAKTETVRQGLTSAAGLTPADAMTKTGALAGFAAKEGLSALKYLGDPIARGMIEGSVIIPATTGNLDDIDSGIAFGVPLGLSSHGFGYLTRYMGNVPKNAESALRYTREWLNEKTPAERKLLSKQSPLGLHLIADLESMAKGFGGEDAKVVYHTPETFAKLVKSMGESAMAAESPGVFIQPRTATEPPTVHVQADTALASLPHEVLGHLFAHLDAMAGVDSKVLTDSKQRFRDILMGVDAVDANGNPVQRPPLYSPQALRRIAERYYTPLGKSPETMVVNGQEVLTPEETLKILQEIESETGRFFAHDVLRSNSDIVARALAITKMSDAELEKSIKETSSRFGQSPLLGVDFKLTPEVLRGMAQKTLDTLSVTRPKGFHADVGFPEGGAVVQPATWQNMASQKTAALETAKTPEEILRATRERDELVDSEVYGTRRKTNSEIYKEAAILAQAKLERPPTETEIRQEMTNVNPRALVNDRGGAFKPGDMPMLLTKREQDAITEKYNVQVREAMRAAGPQEDPNAVHIFTNDKGEEMFRGRYFTPEQVQQLRLIDPRMVPKHHIENIILLNSEMQRGTGRSFNYMYHKAIAKRGNVPRQRYVASPFGWYGSKADNVSARVLDVTALERDIARESAKKSSEYLDPFREFGEKDLTKAADRFREKFFQYLDNHLKGLPGETGLHPDAKRAVRMKDALNGFLGINKGVNPLSRDSSKIKSNRVDRMFNAQVSAADPTPIDYGKVKMNFMPKPKDTWIERYLEKENLYELKNKPDETLRNAPRLVEADDDYAIVSQKKIYNFEHPYKVYKNTGRSKKLEAHFVRGFDSLEEARQYVAERKAKGQGSLDAESKKRLDEIKTEILEIYRKEAAYFQNDEEQPLEYFETWQSLGVIDAYQSGKVKFFSDKTVKKILDKVNPQTIIDAYNELVEGGDPEPLPSVAQADQNFRDWGDQRRALTEKAHNIGAEKVSDVDLDTAKKWQQEWRRQNPGKWRGFDITDEKSQGIFMPKVNDTPIPVENLTDEAKRVAQFWLAPNGKIYDASPYKGHEEWATETGAVVLPKDASNLDHMRVMDTLYNQGWIRGTVEHDTNLVYVNGGNYSPNIQPTMAQRKVLRKIEDLPEWVIEDGGTGRRAQFMPSYDISMNGKTERISAKSEDDALQKFKEKTGFTDRDLFYGQPKIVQVQNPQNWNVQDNDSGRKIGEYSDLTQDEAAARAEGEFGEKDYALRSFMPRPDENYSNLDKSTEQVLQKFLHGRAGSGKIHPTTKMNLAQMMESPSPELEKVMSESMVKYADSPKSLYRGFFVEGIDDQIPPFQVGDILNSHAAAWTKRMLYGPGLSKYKTGPDIPAVAFAKPTGMQKGSPVIFKLKDATGIPLLNTEFVKSDKLAVPESNMILGPSQFTVTRVKDSPNGWVIDVEPTGVGNLKQETQFMPLAPSNERFYSTLRKTLEDKMPEKASTEQVLNILKGGAVKADELHWTGIEDFLKGKEKVSKAEVLDYLDEEGKVRIEEVELSNRKSYVEPYTLEDIQRELNAYETEQDRLNQMYGNSEKWPEADVERMQQWDGKILDMQEANAGRYSERDMENLFTRQAPKFGPDIQPKLSLPGGENYRELVISLPLEGEKRTPNEIAREQYGKDFYDLTRSQMEEIQSEIDKKVSSPYTSSHFPDVPNYLAHLRMDDRVDSKGKPGLFIEELQSDRHQQGREQGYAREEEVKAGTKFKVIELPEGGFGVEDENGQIPIVTNTRERAEQRVRELEAQGGTQAAIRKTGIAPAPFSKNWHEFLFKRALAEAVETGKDWLGWTDGSTQADRYDLSTQIDRLEFLKNEKFVDVHGIKNGESMVEKTGIPHDDLKDVVGKDAAQKILDSKTVSGELTGDDLRVGGHGMREFYDKMLPRFAEKYVRKWGGKVEKEILELPANPNVTFAQPKDVEIWKLPITDAMRTEIGQKGQAMFMPKSDRYPTKLQYSSREEALKDPYVFWHGSPSGDFRGGLTGLHLGTFEAAKSALEATIGIPVEGSWDGTREYGKTLLMGKDEMKRQGIFPTGYNTDAPKENYYPTGKATYSNSEPIPLTVKPELRGFKLTGPMNNSPGTPHGDWQANGRMAGLLKRGKAKSGYFYKNIAEDEGSISAVVPGQSHITPVEFPKKPGASFMPSSKLILPALRLPAIVDSPTFPIKPPTNEQEETSFKNLTLALTLLGEARGEQKHGGMNAVAQVILNRARKNNTEPIQEALKPKQFSFWNNPISGKESRKLLQTPEGETALLLATAINEGRDVDDRVSDSLNYYNPKAASPEWGKKFDSQKTPFSMIGNHKFYHNLPKSPNLAQK